MCVSSTLPRVRRPHPLMLHRQIQTKESSMTQSPEQGSANESTVCPSMQAFLFYFLQLGTFGFGGPIALAGHMEKDLVEERKWVSS